MEVMLEDNGLKEFVDQEIPKPVAPNAQNLAQWKKFCAKGRQIILGGVRDHIVSSLCGKETLYSMISLYTKNFYVIFFDDYSHKC